MTKKKTRMLTAEEERYLLDLYLDKGDIGARNLLITAYMPMAIKAAEAFARRGTSQLDDLIQEAALALSQAIDNFNRAKKDSRISTLAPYYIKSALMRHAMDFHGAVRIGTNLHDKKVFMNLRRMVTEIQFRNGGRSITEDDREAMAKSLGVRVEAIRRMEPRIYSADVTVNPTDQAPNEDEPGVFGSILAVEGGQRAAEARMDQQDIMRRILAIIEESYDDRDLDIVKARLDGTMTRSRYAVLVEKYGISVERIRQIQRGALQLVRMRLAQEGINGLESIAT